MINQEFMQLQPYLDQLLATSSLPLTAEQKQTCMQYLSLLKKWSKAYNLTAITEPKKMLTHHLMDSLSLLPFVKGATILDVGTGAGLPGMILAICDSSKQFTLLDSVGKKTRFMCQAVCELGLTNVQIEHTRVENYRNNQGFDVIMTRAVGSIPQLLKETAHLAHSGTVYLFMKGDYPTVELENLEHDFDVIALDVPAISAKRHLVRIKIR